MFRNKSIALVSVITAAALFLVGCNDSEKYVQSEKAAAAANSISFTENAEIDNIKRRLELTSSVSKVGYVVLMNQAGQPVAYHVVKGKITSGSKRLTTPDRSTQSGVRQAPSDEGTYGSSGEYIFFFTQNNAYVQWNGAYLYSDQPIRLRVEPLVINVEQK